MVGTVEQPGEEAKMSHELKDELPNGNYVMVGIDIDTTGRRLIDEIVQLAAFTPNDHFEQYIMPYMNLNPAARQRHQVRVISIGFYRMLKSMQTYKIIKSKSEIAALKDFLDWLEAFKAKSGASDGIILVYHEERKFIPYMILESLKKYSLLDRFTNTVKSFANGLELAKANPNETLKHYNLRKLSKFLLKNEDNADTNVPNQNNSDKLPQNGRPSYQYDRDQFDGNASVRAKLAYNVALKLSNGDIGDAIDSVTAESNMFKALKPFACPIGVDIQELDTQNADLERQNSFRPVFLNYFKTTLYHRVRAVKFRIILAEHGFDLHNLNAIWNEKRSAGILDALQVIQSLKNDDKTELVELFDSYFDPNKTTIKPVIKMTNNRRRSRRVRQNKIDGNSNGRNINTEYGAGGDKSQSVSSFPDSTTKSPTSPKRGSVGGRSQRKRNQRNFSSNNMKTQTPINAEAVSAEQVSQSAVAGVPIVASN